MDLHESIRKDLALFNEDQYTSEEMNVLRTLASLRDVYKELKALDTTGYIFDGNREQEMREIYHATIQNFFSKRSGKRNDIPDLDGSKYDHPID